MSIPSQPLKPPQNEYLGKFVCDCTGYDVFGLKVDPLQDQAILKRVEDSFKKTVTKRGGQLPDGRVRIELTKQVPSDKPIYVFITNINLRP